MRQAEQTWGPLQVLPRPSPHGQAFHPPRSHARRPRSPAPSSRHQLTLSHCQACQESRRTLMSQEGCACVPAPGGHRSRTLTEHELPLVLFGKRGHGEPFPTWANATGPCAQRKPFPWHPLPPSPTRSLYPSPGLLWSSSGACCPQHGVPHYAAPSDSPGHLTPGRPPRAEDTFVWRIAHRVCALCVE